MITKFAPTARACGWVTFVLPWLMLASCGKPPEGPRSSGVAERTNVLPTASAVRPEFEKLQGSWQRPDGGYVLRIQSVGADGQIEAGYFNPNPIHISKALALRAGEETKVFIELRDANYPGCTYSLKYDPSVDQLYGQYFQAALQETFDVTFARMQ